MDQSSVNQMLQRHESLLEGREHRLTLLRATLDTEDQTTPLSRTESDPTDSKPVPVRSHGSMQQPILFKQWSLPANQRPNFNPEDSKPVPVRSHGSMQQPILFKQDPPLPNQSVEKADFEQKSPKQEDPESVFQKLEDNIISFVKNELRIYLKAVTSDEPETFVNDEEGVREAFLKITLNFLRSMKQDKMANLLHNEQSTTKCKCELKTHLQRRFSRVSEGVATRGSPAPLQQIYTELYITEGGAPGVNQEHEVRQIEIHGLGRAERCIRCEDIFKRNPNRPIRTVLTVGVAGVGKTVLTQKFSLDWAKGKTNQDIQLLFPFTFRALNVFRDSEYSLEGLLHHCFRETKGLSGFQQLQVLFIFDGLDECRPPLDFIRTRVVTEPTESASVEELLVNLIRGSLLPSAHLWITTRPVTASQIPAWCISMITEVRGFTDPQKEQYFRKRFRDEQQATVIISHIKSIRSLYIMSYIPIFCWILSTVMEYLMKTREREELPTTLTQMYVHFLVVLLKQKNVKYDDKLEEAFVWTPDNMKMVKSLGKLAFQQLQKGNLIFYDSDMNECGLDASVYSGVLTEIFKEEPGQGQDKVYCFIHLSVQEFLAALYVHQTFINTGTNLLLEARSSLNLGRVSLKPNIDSLHHTAVDQALQSPNGHLDLFLRFLLGLSVEENQRLLKGQTIQAEESSKSSPKTIIYIKQKLNEGISPERSLNLLHCLNELNDHSLVQQQIQSWMRTGRLSEKDMSPAQWTALSFILLSSLSDLQNFDLSRFCSDESALLGLLPVIKASTKATLSFCRLSPLSCGPLATVLSSSSLKQLDLSNNNLQDSGVKTLCLGIMSATCRLETLSLSGCLVTEEGCKHLALALNSNPSHLRHLDLSYNHPGEARAQLLQAQKSSRCKLDSLMLEPSGQQWLKLGLRKYFQELTWDMNSVHPRLRFSDRQTAVMYVNDEQPYLQHHDRFDWYYQVLCAQELSGRCFFQVQWSGAVHVGVAYRGLQRKGKSINALLGGNNESWCLSCSNRGFSVWHKNEETVLPQVSGSHTVRMVGVYVDTKAGNLSFFSVSDRPTLLYSFRTVFSQPLVPIFGFRFGSMGSAVILCPAEEPNIVMLKQL